jgi:hypothetical protein
MVTTPILHHQVLAYDSGVRHVKVKWTMKKWRNILFITNIKGVPYPHGMIHHQVAVGYGLQVCVCVCVCVCTWEVGNRIMDMVTKPQSFFIKQQAQRVLRSLVHIQCTYRRWLTYQKTAIFILITVRTPNLTVCIQFYFIILRAGMRKLCGLLPEKLSLN